MPAALGIVLMLVGVALGVVATVFSRRSAPPPAVIARPAGTEPDNEEIFRRLNEIKTRVDHLNGAIKSLHDKVSKLGAEPPPVRRPIDPPAPAPAPAPSSAALPPPSSQAMTESKRHAAPAAPPPPMRRDEDAIAPPARLPSDPYRPAPLPAVDIAPPAPAKTRERLRIAFNAAVADPDRLTALATEFGALPVEIDGERLRSSPAGNLWLVRDLAGGEATLLPAPDVVRDWQKFYTSMGAMKAKDLLGRCYTLEPGAGLEIVTLPRVALGPDNALVSMVLGVLRGI